MRKINYKSDFDFILRLKDCADPEKTVPFPEGDFDARFWTSSKANSYTASCKDGVYTSCFRTADGGMHFVFDNHRLGIGALKWEPHFEFPNDIYPDGIQDLFRKSRLDIELVDGDGDCPTTAYIEIIAPFIKGEPFTYEDFTPEQIEELQRPATEAAIEALRAAGRAETEADAATAAAERAETAADSMLEIEVAVTDAESKREKAEADREEAEEERKDAETKRAEEFAEWETEIDSKADRSELSNVLAEEPLTPDNFPDINTYTREELKKDLFIDMWNSKLLLYTSSETRDIDGYDAVTDEFILNGLRFSYADALMIDICSETVAGHPISLYDTVVFPVKTLFWPFIAGMYRIDLARMFCGQSHLEILQIQTQFGTTLFSAKISDMFFGCTALKEIRGTIVPQYANSESNLARAFSGCSSLKEVRLRNNKFSISFADSPNLSIDSISFMVTNAANTSAITITVHPEVYTKLTDETNTEWHALLAQAAEKNINFATT